jgi:small subunit ribosomal protein S21
MAETERRPNEPIDKVLRRFKRQLKSEGIINELRKREYFEKPSITKKKDLKAAVRRNIVQQKQDEW